MINISDQKPFNWNYTQYLCALSAKIFTLRVQYFPIAH